MSHAFDNKGSNFDANRDLHEWWSAPVREQFTQKSKCIRHLYDQFEIAVQCACSMGVESRDNCFVRNNSERVNDIYWYTAAI